MTLSSPPDTRRARRSADGLEHLPPAGKRLAWFIATLLKMLLTFRYTLNRVMMVILGESRILRVHSGSPRGQNRVGPQGLASSPSRRRQNIMKEEDLPGRGEQRPCSFCPR